MNRIGMVIIATLALVGLVSATPKKQATLVAPSDLAWSTVPNSGGVEVAPLSGDMMKSAHRVMVKFPAGTVHPLHTHTADIKMVIVSGSFTYGSERQAQKAYGPGSYIVIPGGTKHASGCTSEAPCVLFHEGSSKFDLHAVK